MADHHELLVAANSFFAFSDFPEEVQISILSFLYPSDIAVFSCTCKRFLELCSGDDKVWMSMCERRWGSKTNVKKWGNGNIRYRVLYKTLERYENLVGFWRKIGHGGAPLLFFEWGDSFVYGSKVLSYRDGSYEVVKVPFLLMGLYPDGRCFNLVNPDTNFAFPIDGIYNSGSPCSPDRFLDLKGNICNGGDGSGSSILVNVNFVGKNHIVIDGKQNPSPSSIRKNRSFCLSDTYSDISGDSSGEEFLDMEVMLSGSPPDGLKFEIYECLANRTSPVGERLTRRQRRKDKERAANRWEAEHYVKILNSSPTTVRPLQGLWKGICDSMKLVFFFVSYDDIGGLICRKVGDASDPSVGCSPVFWTSSSKSVDFPISVEEDDLYTRRAHVRPLSSTCIYQFPTFVENEVVTRILHISSSYGLVSNNAVSSTSICRNDEGRVWQYADGSFGFGFLQDSSIVDLKRIAVDDHLLDVQYYSR